MGFQSVLKISAGWLTAGLIWGGQATKGDGLSYDFASEKPAVYSDSAGFGFEPGAAVTTGRGFVTSDAPFYFSAAVREGNYRVTVKLGDPGGESTTTIKAELRRLMVEKVQTARGKFETVSFIVNVRTPQIPGDGEVRLKPREKTIEAAAWDNKLTLEFSNVEPKVDAIKIEKVEVPTLYIAGDSTSTDQPREPFNSWGQMLTRFFKPEIAVANHGESGESLKGFISERRLAKLDTLMKPGDWLFIQMGHNDQKEKGEGVGAFTSYKASLKQMIAAAREHGATPVLITSMNRLTFDGDGKITNSLGDYPEAVRQTAQEEKVALIDLNAMSKPFYEALGPVKAHVAFAGNDTTHHSDYGSYELAKCIVQGIKDARLPLEKFLVSVAAFDPAHPDAPEKFDVPRDPAGPGERPYGN
jgi:lysophospholipase L1-like esterase